MTAATMVTAKEKDQRDLLETMQTIHQGSRYTARLSLRQFLGGTAKHGEIKNNKTIHQTNNTDQE